MAVLKRADTGVCPYGTATLALVPNDFALPWDSSAFRLTLPQEWVRILVTCEGEFDASDG